MSAMVAQDSSTHVLLREKALADGVKDVATELRLIDLGDLIVFVKTGQFANIQDLVNSSVELYFKPGTLTYGWAADLDVSWERPPMILLDMEFRHEAVTAFFGLSLGSGSAGVEIRQVSFERPSPDPAENTARLIQALAAARLN